MSRARPAPTIGRRVVVRLVRLPESLRAERTAYLQRLILRCRPAPVVAEEALACPS